MPIGVVAALNCTRKRVMLCEGSMLRVFKAAPQTPLVNLDTPSTPLLTSLPALKTIANPLPLSIIYLLITDTRRHSPFTTATRRNVRNVVVVDRYRTTNLNVSNVNKCS